MSSRVVGKKPSKTLKAKWIKALRSGEYSQTKQELYNGAENAFCCLGVLACVAGKDKKDLDGESTLDDVGLGNLIGVYNDTDAGDEVDTYQSRLSVLNDDGNKSFNYIASYIERYL